MRAVRWGSNWGRIPDAILGGWRYSPILFAHSGTPVNITRNTNPDSILPGLRPNLVGDAMIPRGQRTIYHWFNTAAFNDKGLLPASGQNDNFSSGDAGRNVVVGPAYVSLDSSLAKDFKVWERYTLDIRIEAFNTANTVHLGDPDGNFNSGTFGQISSVLSGSDREAQLAARIVF